MHARPSHIARLLFAALLIVSFPTIGCAPRVLVKANPTARDQGIRYYRPKPFLKVEPAEIVVDKNRSEIIPGMVRVSLVYLPDFSQEYSIDVRPGLGIAHVDIKLEDGWNLTEIGQNLDSQTDENLKAIGSILGAAGEIVPTASQPAEGPQQSFTVKASNVPIGLYESMIGRDNDGCKRLYGFRYVGFLPFANCPVDMGGSLQNCCGSAADQLYGLGFADGQMVFQPLIEMAGNTPTQSAFSASAATEIPIPNAAPESLKTEQLSLQLRTFLVNRFNHIGEVHSSLTGTSMEVDVMVEEPPNLKPAYWNDVRQAASQWLNQNLPANQPFELQLYSAQSGILPADAR